MASESMMELSGAIRRSGEVVGAREEAGGARPRRRSRAARVFARPRVRVGIPRVRREEVGLGERGGYDGGLIQFEQHGRGFRSVLGRRFAPWVHRVGFSELLTAEPWQATLAECVGMAGFVFLQSCLGGPLGAVWTGLLVTVWIIVLAPSSGAHFNPMVSLSTYLLGRAPLLRTLLFVAAQCAGSLAGSFLLSRSALSRRLSPPFALALGACRWEGGVGAVEMVVGETVLGFALLFIIGNSAFSIQQATLLGPIRIAILIGASVAVLSTAAATAAPGAAFNAARCLGPALITGHTNGHWAHWVGNAAAALLHSLYFKTVPPAQMLQDEDAPTTAFQQPTPAFEPTQHTPLQTHTQQETIPIS